LKVEKVPPRVLFKNANLLDVRSGVLVPDQSVVVEGERIVDVADSGRGDGSANADRTVDVRGRTLMPGLIDCHVHLLQGSASMKYLETVSPTYATAVAIPEIEGTLMRGFTTVRDNCGADYGLVRAIHEGLLTGPRVKFAGRGLSQTGGHADSRLAEETVAPCACHLSTGVVCDGVSEVRRAARDELRRGADHIKIMASGGVGSPTDRVDSVQFSAEELRAIVGEAESANRYVAAHAYPAAAIARALEAGVRSIEHGNLLDESSVDLFVSSGAFLVPTLTAYYWMDKEGARYGAPATSLEKNAALFEAGLRALELATRGGVKIAYGTDLLGPMRAHQLSEFTLRAEVQGAEDVLRSATCVAAELIGESGNLGEIRVGAYADLLVIDGDPLADIGCLTRPEQDLLLIMKSGVVHKELEMHGGRQ
jgi:imidazolonepropionase-like amidohydrolase